MWIQSFVSSWLSSLSVVPCVYNILVSYIRQFQESMKGNFLVQLQLFIKLSLLKVDLIYNIAASKYFVSLHTNTRAHAQRCKDNYWKPQMMIGSSLGRLRCKMRAHSNTKRMKGAANSSCTDPSPVRVAFVRQASCRGNIYLR